MLVALIAVIALAVAGPAQAQDSSVEAYGGNGGDVQSELTSGNDDGSNTGSNDVAGINRAGTGEADSGSLPFTGLDIALLLGGGVVLVAAGAALAVANRRRRGETSLTI